MFYFNLPYLPELSLRCYDFRSIEDLFKPFSTEEDIEGYKYYYCREDGLTAPINYYRALQRGIDFDKCQHIKQNRIKCPTLMIWGLKDMALVGQLAEDSLKCCDNYTIKYIEDCSHWTQIDKPLLVNNYIKEFLNN